MKLIEFILHLDQYLVAAIAYMGPFSYVLLFAIVFAETGLVILPFLPGDSLIFAAGTLAGGGLLNVWAVMAVLIIAAILGDTLNYWIGHKIGRRAFARQNARFFKPSYLAKTQEFYEKHGGKTIIFARFIPIVRTFAPFVAGVGSMSYLTFLTYNIIGGLVWVISLTLTGFFFGRIPVIKNNFELAVIGIIIISLLPAVVELIKHKRATRVAKAKTVSYEEVTETLKNDL